MSDSHPPATQDHPAPASSDAHADEHHDFWQHCRLYLWIGGILFAFTVITVGLSYVNFGTPRANMLIALGVATFKVSLVGAVFMHLKGEVKTVWRPILFTLFFVSGLFLLTLFAWYDPIFSSLHAHH
jgi:caa(3)-type oxidase subunit IV